LPGARNVATPARAHDPVGSRKPAGGHDRVDGDPSAYDPSARDPGPRDPGRYDASARDPGPRDPSGYDGGTHDPVGSRKPAGAHDRVDRDPSHRDPSAYDTGARDPSPRDSSAYDIAAREPAPAASDDAPQDLDPLLDPETLIAARALRERFVGTLLGLAVGDAVGAATQYRRPGTFTPVGDMIGGGPFDLPRGAWTDDTAMALCLAESLLESEGFDARDQVQRYTRWQEDGYLSSTGQCIGITANTSRSLAIAKWRRVVYPGSHDPEQLDPEPLSRIAPIALYYLSSVDTTQQQASESSRTTCQASPVLEACRLMGRGMHAALSGQSKAKIISEAGGTSEAAAQFNNTAAAALAAALWALHSTDNFRDAVLRAANVGGNSDVVASVCGQLAGAHYGFSAIPPSWRNGLMQKDLIETYADRLLTHALVALSK
jgi:ADP-ribosyl-[dinitrogen reductase] hydrolase